MSPNNKVKNNGSAHSNGAAPKVVGPNVQGNREEYQLVRRLQSALFGGVYEAKGLTSNRDFAIKVLHKSELTKAQESSSIEFCEVPLSEIRFAELMRGHTHVMEPEEHFEDAYCFYVVFDLCRGGDLLEALKQKPHGFDEAHAQYLIKQAALGLAFLHERHVAMQDVSLENFLLNVQESTGHYEVKVCDPGQAVIFDVDQDGEEMPVNFRGLVGKSFRPPELHEQQPYFSTKVDSWCLGWSTFYLLTAQPLFMSADPAQQDSDWLLFQNGDFAALFQQKCNLCSPTGLDFIFRLLQIEPRRRMSIADALNHPWLNDATVGPVRAPQDVIAEMLTAANKPLEVVDGYDVDQVQAAPASNQQYVQDGAGPSYSPPTGGKPLTGISYGGNKELPTWASANPDQGIYNGGAGQIFGGVPFGTGNALPFGQSYNDGTPMLLVPMPSQRTRGEVRSPPRSPRGMGSGNSPRTSGGPSLTWDPRPGPIVAADGRERARYANPSRMAHVISTAHSPAPLGRGPSPPPRAGSPLQRQLSPSQNPDLGSGSLPSRQMMPPMSQQSLPQEQPYLQRPAMLTPRTQEQPFRSGSGRHSPGQSPLNSAVPLPNTQLNSAVPPLGSQLNSAVPRPNNKVSAEMDRSRGRAWAFRSESPGPQNVGLRDAVSPAPDFGRVRAPSPFGNANPMVGPGSANGQVAWPGPPSRNSLHSRLAHSPARGLGGSQQGITFPRSMSPGLLEGSLGGLQAGSSAMRAISPGAGMRALSPSGGLQSVGLGSLAGSTRLPQAGMSGSFNWSAAPPLSPRGQGGMSPGVSRISSPTGGLRPNPSQGFAWNPEPASPRVSPRSHSPAPMGAPMNMKTNSILPRWPM